MDSYKLQSLDQLMDGALVTWIKSFEQSNGSEYDAFCPSNNPCKGLFQLTNGCTLHNVMNFIDTRPYHGNLDLHGLKMRLQSYYQDELQQLILMPLPDTFIISQEPFSDISMQEMEKLLSLMLGAAVQCENREQIIMRIQTLSLDSQTMLAEKIKEMTQDSQKILAFPGPDLSYLSHSDLQKVVHILSTHLKDILRQRDETQERLSLLRCDQQTVLIPHTDPKPQRMSQKLISEPQAWKSYSLRIVELQSKLQLLRQELEEKGEELLDSQQQVQLMEAEKRKLHQQVLELSSISALTCGYRDELDALREHSRHYEAKITSLTEKLRNMDFYRRSLQEEKEFSEHLMEDKEVLEQQLATERERSERLRLCEREKMALEEKLQRVEMERDSECQRVQLLLHDNLSLAEEIRVMRWNTMYESDPKTDGETEDAWERLQGNDTEFLDLNSELSEALLRLERENQSLKQRLHTLKEEKQDSETSAQHAQCKKDTQSLNQEAEKGSFAEKELLQKEWERKPHERPEPEQLTNRQYMTDINEQCSKEQLVQNFEDNEIQRGSTEEMSSEENIQKEENRDKKTVEELHGISIKQSLERLVDDSVDLRHESELEKNYNKVQVLKQLEESPLEKRSIEQHLENRNTEDSEPVQIQLGVRERDTMSLLTQLDEKDNEIQVHKRQLEIKSGEIQMLKKQLVEKEDEKQFQQRLLQESITLTEYLQTHLLQSEESHLLNKHLQESTEEIQSLTRQLEESIQVMKSLTRQLHESELQPLQKQVVESAREMQSQKKHLEGSIVDNQLMKGQLEEKELLEQSLKRKLEEITADIQVVKREMQNSTTVEQSLRKQLEQTERDKHSCDKQLEVCSQEVQFLKRHLQEKEEQVQSLKRELQEMTEETKYLKKQMGELHDVYLIKCKQVIEESEDTESVLLKRQLHKTAEEEKCLVKNIFKGGENERNSYGQLEGKEEEMMLKTELQDTVQETLSLKRHLNTGKGHHNLNKKLMDNVTIELQLQGKRLVKKAENIQCQEKQVEQKDKERDIKGWKSEASSEETQSLKAMFKEREVDEHVLRRQVHEMDMQALDRQLKEKEEICVLSQLQESTKETNAQQRQPLNTEEAYLLKTQLAESAWETESLRRELEENTIHLEESTYKTQSLKRRLLQDRPDEIKALQSQLQSSPEQAQCVINRFQMNMKIAECLDKQAQDTHVDQQTYRIMLEETTQKTELKEIQLEQCTVKEHSLICKSVDREKAELPHTGKLKEGTEALQIQLHESILKMESPSRHLQQHHQKGPSKKELLKKNKTKCLPQERQFKKAQAYSQKTKMQEQEQLRVHFKGGTDQLLYHPLLSLNHSELSKISVNPIQKPLKEPFHTFLTVSVPFVSLLPITTANVPALPVSTSVSSIPPSLISVSSPSSSSVPVSTLSLPASTSGFHSSLSSESPVPQLSNPFPTPIYIHEPTLSLLLLEVQEVRKERAEIQERYESLLRDMQRQEVELGNAQREQHTGRSALRALRQEHQKLQQRFLQLSANGEQVQQQQQVKLKEQECNMQKLQVENQKLQEEQKRLQDEISTLEMSMGDKIAELREVKRQFGMEQRQKEQLERECREMKESVQRLEISNTALSDHYQVLSQVKLSLQDQNNLLLSQIHTLSRDNRELLERSLESGELRQEEERRYREKLTELKNEKQKLLDKIMDQYRVLEPASIIPSHHNRRGNWIADKMKRLLRSRERSPKTFSESPVFLSPPNEPPAEAAKTTKSTAVLRRSKSSVSSASLPAHETNTSSRHGKLSSTIRSSESFGEADSTPRERFRLRRRGQILDSNTDGPAELLE